MKTYLVTAFSPNMLAAMLASGAVDIRFSPATAAEVKALLANGFTSAVGHASTVPLLEEALGVPTPAARATIDLTPEDVLILAQYIGDRLPEGATTLPPGARLDWLVVRRSGLRDAVVRNLEKNNSLSPDELASSIASIAKGEREYETVRKFVEEECHFAWWAGHNGG